MATRTRQPTRARAPRATKDDDAPGPVEPSPAPPEPGPSSSAPDQPPGKRPRRARAKGKRKSLTDEQLRDGLAAMYMRLAKRARSVAKLTGLGDRDAFDRDPEIVAAHVEECVEADLALAKRYPWARRGLEAMITTGVVADFVTAHAELLGDLAENHGVQFDLSDLVAPLFAKPRPPAGEQPTDAAGIGPRVYPAGAPSRDPVAVVPG